MDEMNSRKIQGFEWLIITSSGMVYSTSTSKYVELRINNHGYQYVVIYKGSVKYRLHIHRLVAEHFLENENNYPVVDHIDNNRINNNVSNLRWCTYSQNAMNTSKRKQNKSGVVGVSVNRKGNKWYSKITVNGKIINLGTFTNIEDARLARIEAEKKYFGEFRNNINDIP